MVSRGRTTATAGTSATRSPTTSTTATRTATTKAAPAKAATTTTRKTITQSAAGQAVQAQFKQAVSSAVESVGIDFGVPTVKTTIQETATEIITITEKPEVIEEQIIEEPVIEEQIIEEPIIEFPELIPEVFAEEQINLSDDIIQILNDIENGVILVPTWFRNNIEWVKNGHITQQEFRTAYNYLVDTQIAHPAKTGIGSDPTITNNMINQHLDYFTIENGRAKGQITFTLNDNFNPSYYNTDLVNIIQFKTKSGANILPFVKENRLRFTETERQEKIQYDENMEGNIIADLESFVWLGTTTPTAFSTVLRSEIKEGQAATLKTTGFMSAGITGAIAGLILIGFIADHKRGK